MKWERAIMTKEKAKSIQESFECGDAIVLNELLDFLDYATGKFAHSDKIKLKSLAEAAYKMNDIIIEMEMGECFPDAEYQDLYHEIMGSIYGYLDKIINEEVL